MPITPQMQPDRILTGFSKDIQRFNKSKESIQRIYFDLSLNKSVCEKYDLKYFKLISLNLTEQSIQKNIENNSISENIFSVAVLN